MNKDLLEHLWLNIYILTIAAFAIALFSLGLSYFIPNLFDEPIKQTSCVHSSAMDTILY